ncbi:MAG: hypothetical protein PHV30_07955 [Candidatus Margulisbacteria bacterium]|nr:hypothetical protein [Candidatus Margulisiibacteriota bacterium]
MRTSKVLFVVIIIFGLLSFSLARGPGKGKAGETSVSLEDLKNRDTQLQTAGKIFRGNIQALKPLKKIAIAEFTVCYLTSYEDERMGLETQMKLAFNDDNFRQGSDLLYDSFVKKFQDAGYEVVPKADVQANANFQKLAGKDSEDMINYTMEDKKTMKFRMIPATGFKATGGGIGAFGSGEAANALAQMGNRSLYPRITKDLGADATITVHLNVGFDKNFKLVVFWSRSGVSLMKIYQGFTDDGHDNVAAVNEYEIHNSFFTLTEALNVSGKELTFKEYMDNMDMLQNSLLDCLLTAAKQ